MDTEGEYAAVNLILPKYKRTWWLHSKHIHTLLCTMEQCKNHGTGCAHYWRAFRWRLPENPKSHLPWLACGAYHQRSKLTIMRRSCPISSAPLALTATITMDHQRQFLSLSVLVNSGLERWLHFYGDGHILFPPSRACHTAKGRQWKSPLGPIGRGP